MSRPRILILGDRPGPRTDPLRPMYPHTTTGAAAKLADLMGLSLGEYVRTTLRLNAWHDGHKVLTPVQAQDQFAEWIAENVTFRHPEKVLLISVGVHAHRISDRYTQPRVGPPNLLIKNVPHTSGVCRAWNDKEFLEGTKARLTALTAQFSCE